MAFAELKFAIESGVEANLTLGQNDLKRDITVYVQFCQITVFERLNIGNIFYFLS